MPLLIQGHIFYINSADIPITLISFLRVEYNGELLLLLAELRRHVLRVHLDDQRRDVEAQRTGGRGAAQADAVLGDVQGHRAEVGHLEKTN